MAKQPYYRTAALLGAQPLNRVEQRRQVARPLQIPWKWIAVVVVLAGLPLWAWLDARWYVDATRLQVAGASLDTAREVVLAGNVLDCMGSGCALRISSVRCWRFLPSQMLRSSVGLIRRSVLSRWRSGCLFWPGRRRMARIGLQRMGGLYGPRRAA